MGSKDRYKKNRARVYEIYGIDPKDPDFNCHHICFKRDAKKGRFFEGGDLDAKGNLIPLDKRVHAALHKKIDQMEHYESTGEKKPKKKRLTRSEKRRSRRKKGKRRR